MMMVGSLITTIQSFLPSISPPPSVQLTVTAVNSETLLLLNTGADPLTKQLIESKQRSELYGKKSKHAAFQFYMCCQREGQPFSISANNSESFTIHA